MLAGQRIRRREGGGAAAAHPFSVAHDPNTLNRQGPDVGSQYRSAVFHRNPDRKRVTESSPYIATYDLPKIANLKSTLPQLYRGQPVLVSAQPKV